MREIVFRGKRTDNGEWVEGWYIHTKRHHCIITGCIDDGYVVYGHYASDVAMYVVNPATVGQYTGLKDKNGRRIFDGDELSWHNGSGAVNFDGGCFCVRLHGEIEYYGRNNPAIDVIFNLYPELEVIGNIHDNPEMLEVR